jgi:uncharacterized protein (DUF952 family)
MRLAGSKPSRPDQGSEFYQEARNYYLKDAKSAIHHSNRNAGLEVAEARRYGHRMDRSDPENPKRIQLLTEIHKPVSTIYKVCPASAWREAERQGAYRGSADDRRDGFIHFSTAPQLPGTVAKHFAGQTGLFLVAVDADALGDALKWEPSRGGELFPHLYSELDFGAVKEILELRARSDGSHDIPELPK